MTINGTPSVIVPIAGKNNASGVYKLEFMARTMFQKPNTQDTTDKAPSERNHERYLPRPCQRLPPFARPAFGSSDLHGKTRHVNRIIDLLRGTILCHLR